MPRNPEISKDEQRSLHEGLLRGISRRELERVVEHASRQPTPYSSFEERMVDAVCYQSHQLGQYWPPCDEREAAMQLAHVISASVASAAADDIKLRQAEAKFAMEVVQYHPGHSPW